jgi:gamma-glutamylaminecyclotransferase
LFKIAVYGTLKKGFHNHDLLKNSKFLGVGISKRRFLLGHYAYPAIVVGERGTPIEVEIYSVTAEILVRIDVLEGYPDFYKRSLEKFQLNNEEVETFIYHLSKKQKKFFWIEPNSDIPYRWTKTGWFPILRSK